MSTLIFPYAGNVRITSATTNADGVTYTSFPDFGCTALEISNTTGVALEYRRNGAGETMTIPAGTVRQIIGITNANQIGVRRLDVAITPVRVPAETMG